MEERILDLHYRVPYNTYIEIEGYGTHLLKSIDGNTVTIDRGINYPLRLVKAYLRPISSMTEEEIDKLFDILSIDKSGNSEDWIKINDVLGIKFFFTSGKWIEDVIKAYDYLNSIHIDYRGLIEDNEALEAPKDMYKTD